MRKYTVLFLFLFVFLVFPSMGFAKEPEDQAPKSYFVINTATGSIIREKNPDLLIPPASLTKVMTMYLLLDALQQEKINRNDRVKISVAATKAGGRTMRLEANTTVELENLMWAMSIISANDAAVALAEHVSGTVDAFVKAMNQQARKMGMKNTTFINPNGMPGEGGAFTTARDMAILAHSYITRFPWTLEAIHSKTSFTYNNITQSNANRLLGKYPEVDGLKTGFTKASGYHVIVTAMKGMERHIIVVMGAGTFEIRNEEAALFLEEILDISPSQTAPPSLITIEPYIPLPSARTIQKPPEKNL